MKIETLSLTSVIPDPGNVRLHDDRNLDTIRGSLARFGQQKPIVIDSAGVIRAGNGTYMAAKSLGWTTIDVVRTSLEGLDAAAFAIADNRTSDLSTFDDASLAKLLVELRTEDALEGVGFDLGEIDELLASLAVSGVALLIAALFPDEKTRIVKTIREGVDAIGDRLKAAAPVLMQAVVVASERVGSASEQARQYGRARRSMLPPSASPSEASDDRPC